MQRLKSGSPTLGVKKGVGAFYQVYYREKDDEVEDIDIEL